MTMVLVVLSIALPPAIDATGPQPLVSETTFTSEGIGHTVIVVESDAAWLGASIEGNSDEPLAILFSGATEFRWFIHTPIAQGFSGPALRAGTYQVYALTTGATAVSITLHWDAPPGSVTYDLQSIRGMFERMPETVADGDLATRPLYLATATRELDADSALLTLGTHQVVSVGAVGYLDSIKLSDGLVENDCGVGTHIFLAPSPVGMSGFDAATWFHGPGQVRVSSMTVPIGASLDSQAYLGAVNLVPEDSLRDHWVNPFWNTFWHLPGADLVPGDARPTIQGGVCAAAAPDFFP